MKRLDRAMYGLFLLVLLADVARLHAAVPGNASEGLILRAPSRIGESPAVATALNRGRQAAPFSNIAGFKRISLRLSGWTKNWTRNFSKFPAPILQFDSASASVADSLPASFAAIPSLAIFEHSASPAP